MWNHSFYERSAIYRIAENFGGRKLSRFLLFQNHLRKFSLRNAALVSVCILTALEKLMLAIEVSTGECMH